MLAASAGAGAGLPPRRMPLSLLHLGRTADELIARSETVDVGEIVPLLLEYAEGLEELASIDPSRRAELLAIAARVRARVPTNG